MKTTAGLLTIRDHYQDMINSGLANSRDQLLYDEFTSVLFSKDKNLVKQFIEFFSLSNEIIRKAFVGNAFAFVKQNANNTVLRYLIQEEHISCEELSIISGKANLIHDAAYFGSSSIVKTLLENKVTPDIINNNKMTPLMYASMFGNGKTVKLLLSEMTKDFIDVTTPEGRTFLDIIDAIGKKELLITLRNHASLEHVEWNKVNCGGEKFSFSSKPDMSNSYYNEFYLGNSFLYKLAFSDTGSKNKFRKAVSHLNKMKDLLLKDISSGDISSDQGFNIIFQYTIKMTIIFKLYYETNTDSTYYAKNILLEMFEVLKDHPQKDDQILSLYNVFFVIAESNKDWNFTNYIMKEAILCDTNLIDTRHLFCLYYNYAQNLRRLGNNKDALEYYYKSHAITSNDVEVLNAIIAIELNNENYELVLDISELYEDDVVKKVYRFYTKILSGSEDFNELLIEYSDYQTWAESCKGNIIYLDLINLIARKSGDSCRALENSEKFLELYQNHDLREQILIRVINELYLMEDQDLAIKVAEKYEEEYLAIGEIVAYGVYLQKIACILFINNKVYDKASRILEKYQDSLDLHNLYKISMVTAMSYKDYGTARKHIEFFQNITTDTELLAKISRDLSLIEVLINPEGITASTPNYDFELYDNAQETEEVDFAEYTATEIHQYYQGQKKFLDIAQTKLMHGNCNQTTEQWLVGDRIFDSNDGGMVQLSSNYYAVIDFEILYKLESIRVKQFTIALSKGYCKKAFKSNGVKVILGKLFELKINNEDRLYSPEILVNKEGKKLVVFDKYCKNHKTMQKIIADSVMTYFEPKDDDTSLFNNSDERSLEVELSGDDPEMESQNDS